jgi:hypothetical protein
MPRREAGREGVGQQPFPVQAAPRPLRFRAQAEPGGDPMRRRWQAIFSYGEGWTRFQFVVNLNRSTLTFHRSLDVDYTPMLRVLAGKSGASLTPLPPPTTRVDSLTFDVEIVGLKMSRVDAGAFKAGPAGDWLVVQAFVPRGSESFLVGVNDRLAAAEIVITRPEAAASVVHALTQVFG